MKQIINPYIRFRQKAQGRFANRISDSDYARAITLDETKCFYIVSASAGFPSADWWTVCFNVIPDETTCLTQDFDFRNLTNVNTLIWGATNNPGGDCLQWEKGTAAVNNSSGPLDELVLDYVPGTCHKDSTDNDECLLDPYSGFSVENNIWGPSFLRAGDLADNIVLIGFDADASVIGSEWEIKVNGTPQAGMIGSIVAGNIQFSLPASINAGDTVLCSHQAVDTTGAQSIDGRYCWRFFDEPVDNVVGTQFWGREDGGAWLVEDAGRWQTHG